MTQADAHQLVEQLELIHRALVRSIKARGGRYRTQAEESGITVPQQMLVMELSRNDGLSLKDLSGRMGLSHSTVSGIVDRLERQRIVRRETDAGDRRVTRIYLSEKVKRFVKTARADIYAPVVGRIMAAPARERAQIAGGLARLCAVLQKEDR